MSMHNAAARRDVGQRLVGAATVSLGGLAVLIGVSTVLLSGTASADTDTSSSASSSTSSSSGADTGTRGTAGRDERDSKTEPKEDAPSPTRDDDNADSDTSPGKTSLIRDRPDKDTAAADDTFADGDESTSDDDADDDGGAPAPPPPADKPAESADLSQPSDTDIDADQDRQDDRSSVQSTPSKVSTASPVAVQPTALVDASADSPRPTAEVRSAPPSITELTPPEAAQALLAWAERELRTAFAAPWPNPQIAAAIARLNQDLNDFFAGFNPAAYPPPGPATNPPPSADDVAATPFGDLGKWMLRPIPPPAGSPPGTEPTYAISDWLGQQYGGRQLLEPINVVIIDRTSTSAEQSQQKLITTLGEAGFPIRVVHSTGYVGYVDGAHFDQTPEGKDQAFSNCFYIFPNDHARFFGPAPEPAPLPDGTGFVWTAALSREQVGLYDWSFTHRYVSFASARDTLRDNLLHNGATDLGMISLNNAVNSPTQFTGDHDGYAAVIALT